MTATTSGITNISALPGMTSLWDESLGDSQICIAVLDGPVDQSHPCFDGAQLSRLPTLVSDAAGEGHMSNHGTHITSVIFGQHGSTVPGIAPRCRGLIVPIFSDSHRGPLSQLDLARAINQAVEQGAHVINVSGGQLSQSGESDPMLTNAVRFCNDNGVLIVAAAGNDACQCLHIPAALPLVLAVGAMNAQGLPLDFSNWGEAYQTQGILAPGENILGAMSGGDTALRSGTSFATPIVSGIVALLLSIQLKRGEKLNPHAIRDAILKSALPCNIEVVSDCRRFLVGSLNIPGAYALITKGGIEEMAGQKPEVEMIQPSEVPNANQVESINQTEVNHLSLTDATNHLTTRDATSSTTLATGTPSTLTVQASTNHIIAAPGNMAGASTIPISNEALPQGVIPGGMYFVPSVNGLAVMPNHINPSYLMVNQVGTSGVTPSNVMASEGCGCNGNGKQSLVYALGIIGYDFGTEARRDSFKQLMPMVNPETGLPSEAPNTNRIPPNPYDARQMVTHLTANPSEAKSLIWTLNLELTPIYAIEPQGPFAIEVYQYLREFLEGQVRDERDEEYIERVSIPAVMTGRSVTLFSGQTVPVIEPVNTRGMYGWKVRALINEVIAQAIPPDSSNMPSDQIQQNQLREDIEFALENFLLRIYYDLRNLGQTSQERALNFAATNSFQFASALARALHKRRDSSGSAQTATMQLDGFEVERSPFCRMDSDCWDVKIKFFDPDNERRAKTVVRYTIDVSDIMPVTLGQPRIWQVPN
jgi:cyanobactin maturation PatA/PatG family protease